MSIVQVAKHAGVSPGTVSRVINGRDGISKKTVVQVHDAMKKLAYVPRSIDCRPGKKARSVAHSSSTLETVALIATKLYKSQINSPVYAEVIHGVESCLAQRGLNMMLSVIFDFNRIPKFLLRKQVGGLVLFGFSNVPEKIEAILQQYPTVSVMGGNSPWCDRVTYDNSVIGAMAADYLLKKGHKQLAYIGQQGMPAFDERALRFEMEAKKNAVNPHMLSRIQLLQVNSKVNMIDKYKLGKVVEELVALSPRPTGVFVPADMLVTPLYSLLLAHGIRPGKDIEVVSVNNEKVLLDGVIPRPATIDIQAYSIGQMAVERLMWRLENPEEQRVTLSLDPKLVESE